MSDSVSGGRIERDAVDRLLEGVQILDFEWRYLFVNPAAAAQNRLPAGELLGRRYQECWPGIEQTEVYARIGGVLAGGPADEMENRFVYPSGEVGWFELRFLPVSDGVLILSVDVSERRLAEEHLRNTLRLYRTLSEVNQAVVRTKEVQALYDKVCEVAVRYGGFTVAWLGTLDEATGDVVPQAASGIALDPWPFPTVNLNGGPLRSGLAAESIRSGRVYAVDDVLAEGRGKDYRALAAQLKFRGAAAVPFRTGEGRPGTLVLLSERPGLLGSGSDRALLEEIGGDLSFALETIEKERLTRQWADAFEHSAHGVVIGDPLTNSVRSCNPAFAKMMRSSREELQGSPFLDTYNPDLRPRIEAKLRQADEEGSAQFEAIKTRPDGTTFSALLEVVSVRDDKGQLLYRVTTIQDQSESKRLQAELIQSQKLESLGTLSSGVAHDFNNLLAVILGNAALLREHPGDGAAATRRLEAIVKAGHRGADLVKQLLTFARKADVHFQPLDLNAVVEEVSSLLVETLPRSIAVQVHLEKDLPAVAADASQVNQVLVNLAVNARDSMPDGGTLTFRTGKAAHEGVDYGVVAVSDTGTGMDRETQARVFEPFFTTKPLGKGTGLGLSTVFGILQGHRGRIEIESELSEGTTFRCWFPASGLASAPAAAAVGGTKGRVAGTLLLVEDEEALRFVLQEQFTRSGFRVFVAPDAIEATALFQQHRDEISLVVSDLGLPGSDGADLFRVLKSLDRAVRFVLASGYFEPGLQARLQAEGVQGFLQKPYEVDQVAAILGSTDKKSRPPKGPAPLKS